MMNLEEKKKQEIKRMVGIAEQIDLTGIYLLTRDAITLLTHRREVEARGRESGEESRVRRNEKNRHSSIGYRGNACPSVHIWSPDNYNIGNI